MTIEIALGIAMLAVAGVGITALASLWFNALLKVNRNMERMVWILDQIRLEGLPVQAPEEDDDDEGEEPESSEEEEEEEEDEQPPAPVPATAPPPVAMDRGYPWGTKYTSISVVRDGQKVEKATVDPAELDAIMREVQDLAGGFYSDAHSERMSALMKRVRDMTDKVSKAGEAVPSAPTEVPST